MRAAFARRPCNVPCPCGPQRRRLSDVVVGLRLPSPELGPRRASSCQIARQAERSGGHTRSTSRATAGPGRRSLSPPIVPCQSRARPAVGGGCSASVFIDRACASHGPAPDRRAGRSAPPARSAADVLTSGSQAGDAPRLVGSFAPHGESCKGGRAQSRARWSRLDRVRGAALDQVTVRQPEQNPNPVATGPGPVPGFHTITLRAPVGPRR